MFLLGLFMFLLGLFMFLLGLFMFLLGLFMFLLGLFMFIITVSNLSVILSLPGLIAGSKIWRAITNCLLKHL